MYHPPAPTDAGDRPKREGGHGVAVAEGERSQSKLEVIVRALDLATYTIRITNNQKIFLPEYRSSLTDDIIRTAKRHLH